MRFLTVLTLSFGLLPMAGPVSAGETGEPIRALRFVEMDDGGYLCLNEEGTVVGRIRPEVTLEAAGSTPPQLPGWPLMSGEIDTTPLVTDIDGDGQLEVVAPSRDSNLYVLRADGSTAAGWPYRLATRGLQNAAAMDLDGDGRMEIAASTLQDVVVVGHDGTVREGWPVPGSGFSGPAIGDLDGDGEVEIAAMDRTGHAHLFDPRGAERPGWPFAFPSPFAMSNLSSALGDVDGDGILEIAIPIAFDPSLFVLRVDGTSVPGFPLFLTPAGLKEGVSMGDVEGDGRQEMFLQHVAGVRIVDGTGATLPGWPYPPQGGNAPPAIGDLDGDGRLELVFGTVGGNAEVWAFRDDGSVMPGWPVVVGGVTFNTQVTLGDVDGDGRVDVVLGGFGGLGLIAAWHEDGTRVGGFPYFLPPGYGILASSVTITDLDQDGDVDLLVGAVTGLGGGDVGGIFAFDLAAPYDPTTMEWPTFGHDIQRTGRYSPPPRRPVTDAGGDRQVECASPAGAWVTLDGSASSDGDSTPGTNDDLASFAWFEGLGGPEERPLGEGEVLSVELALGEHAITLEVTDRSGLRATDEIVVTVADTKGPSLGVTAEPAVLWPPNHRLVAVEVGLTAADLCDPSPVVALVSATSSEPADAPGPEDGETWEDIVGAEPGTADTELWLRAERDGRGAGRTYELRYEAGDASGNVTAGLAVVQVPHDQGSPVEGTELHLERASSGALWIFWPASPGALGYDLLRGERLDRSWSPESVLLGPVEVLERGTVATGHLESGGSIPPPGSMQFYVMQHRTAAGGSGYGLASVPWPRQPAACDGGCP